MKYALIADIHSNIEALEAVLAHAAQQGAERHAFIGDLVGYGPDPAAVIERIQQCAAAGDIVVLGNHDAAIAGNGQDSMNQEALTAVRWTQERLSESHLAFLRELPLQVQRDEATFVHASAAAPELWPYVRDGLRAEASMDAAGTPWTFSGHVHEPTLYYNGRDNRVRAFYPSDGVAIPVPAHRKWLAIVGACGQPRDRTIGARYVLFDREQCSLQFFRIPYEYSRVAQKIRAAGLPERFALHIEGRL